MNLHVYQPQTAVHSDLGPLVFLHGFPGARSEQNREVAQKVANLTGREAIVLLYAGVDDKSRMFTFKGCIEEVQTYFAELLANEKRPIALVGHSWGGFLALTLIEKFAKRLDRVVLMSPLLEFATLDVVIPAFMTMYENNPQLSIRSVFELSNEFSALETGMPAARMIRSIPTDISILFLQSRFDDTTPTPTTEAKLKEFKRPPIFELVDTEHNFLSNRDQVSDRVAHFLMSGD